MTRLLLIAVVLAALAGPACRVFRRGAARPVPPPPPPPVLTLPEPERAGPALLPEPPEIPPEQVDLSELPEPDIPLGPWPPAPRRGRKSARQPGAPEVTAQTPPPVEPQPAPPPAAPQLGQVLTPEQQQVYNTSIEKNLDRAQRTVAALRGKRLSHDQVTYLERIRAFIEQAGEARKTDLVRAASLAERASVLAEDLFKSVQ